MRFGVRERHKLFNDKLCRGYYVLPCAVPLHCSALQWACVRVCVAAKRLYANRHGFAQAELVQFFMSNHTLQVDTSLLIDTTPQEASPYCLPVHRSTVEWQ